MMKTLLKAKQKLTDRERVIAYVIRILNEKQHEGIRALIPDYTMPKKVVREATGEGYIPEVTAFKNGEFRLFAVETKNTLREQEAEKRWELFASYSQQNKAQFYVVFPVGVAAQVKDMLARTNIEARLWQASVD
jgi:hypothetical protein